MSPQKLFKAQQANELMKKSCENLENRKQMQKLLVGVIKKSIINLSTSLSKNAVQEHSTTLFRANINQEKSIFNF